MKGVAVTLSIINETIRDRNVYGEDFILGKCQKCGTSLNIRYNHALGKISIPCTNEQCDCSISISAKDVSFVCLLSFISKSINTYLPPFLPSFNFRISDEEYYEIREKTDELNSVIEKNFGKNNELILKHVETIGRRIFRLDKKVQDAIEHIYRGNYGSLVIFTNDASIPWHWIYNNYRHSFLLDFIPCGTIYTEKMADTLRNYEKRKKWAFEKFDRTLDENTMDALKNKKILLAIGDIDKTDESESQELEFLEREENELRNIFIKNFKKENIIKIPFSENSKENYNDSRNISGADQIATITARDNFRKNIKIIHFAGHIYNESVVVDSLTKKKTKLFLGKRFGSMDSNDFMGDKYDSEPLIFLNGCSSGETFNVWDKSANLATSLLNKNASACIVSLAMVEDKESTLLSTLFYKRLLDDCGKITYGEALLDVRKIMEKKDPYNPTRLFFHLFGDPNAKLVYIRRKSDSMLEMIYKMKSEK